MEKQELNMAERFKNQNYLYYDALCSLYGSSNKYKGLIQLYEDTTSQASIRSSSNVILNGVLIELKFIGEIIRIKFITFDNIFEINDYLRDSKNYNAIISWCNHGLPHQDDLNIRIGNVSYSHYELGGHIFTMEMKVCSKKAEELNRRAIKEELLNLLEDYTNAEFGSFELQYNDHKSSLYDSENPEKIKEYYAPNNEEDLEDFSIETRFIDWTEPIYRLYWYKDNQTGSYDIIDNDTCGILAEVKKIIKRENM